MVRRPQGPATDVWRFKSQAMRVGQSFPIDGDAEVAPEGGPRRASSDESWPGQRLHGAPPPRDPEQALSRLVAHG